MKNKPSNKFKVPATYFDTLENEILAKVKEDNMKKVVPLYQRAWVKATIGIAACLLLIFGVYFSTQEKVTPEDRAVATEFIYEFYFEEDDLDEFTLEDESIYEEMVLLADD